MHGKAEFAVTSHVYAHEGRDICAVQDEPPTHNREFSISEDFSKCNCLFTISPKMNILISTGEGQAESYAVH